MRPTTPLRLAFTVGVYGVYGQLPEMIWIPGSRYVSFCLCFFKLFVFLIAKASRIKSEYPPQPSRPHTAEVTKSRAHSP